MYRATYTDKAGHIRKAQGYYTLNKANSKKYRDIVLDQARDKVSAANKIQKQFHLPVSASNLVEVSMKLGKLYQEALALQGCW